MRRWKSIAVVVALMMLVAACGGGGESSETTSDGGTDTTEGSTDTTQASTDTTADSDGSGDKVTVRWFIGLGAGGQPEQEAAQRAVVDAFNASQDEIELVIEIVENDVAYETLATEIASGNAPDIIGPVGRDGSNEYSGLYLDIEPFVGDVDTSMWEEAAIDNQREPDGTLVGLPFASYPSVLYYNRDLFDEAGLPYPPSEYGPDGLATYGEGTEWEGPWDFDKVTEIAKILTVDGNGVDATDPSFDRSNTVQWGFHWQWTTRIFQNGAYWGAGYPVADDGTADIPQAWQDEWAWWHDAIWNLGIAPSQEQMDAVGDNVFQTGNLAMAATHLWYTCCIADPDNGITGDFWDMAALPANDGVVTANMHADTFRILSSTEHPQEAFDTMYYLLTEAALPLLQAYGGAPADPSLTEDYLAGLDERYPQGVNWDVALAGAAFADDPSHESNVPGWGEYKVRMSELESAILADPDLDLAAEIDQLESDLTGIFEANAE